MDARQFVLDTCQVGAFAICRRGLVARQRPGVVADQRPQIARALLDLGGVGIPERESSIKVIECVGVGEHGRSMLRGAAVVAGGRRMITGHAQMLRSERRALVSGRRPQQRLRHAAVNKPAACEADLLIHERAQLVVGEVVRGLRHGELADEPAPKQLLEPIGGLLLAAPARCAHAVELERATDHGRCLEQLPGDRAEPRQAALEEVVQLLRNRTLVEVAFLGDDGQVLRDEEGKALGFDVDAPLEAGPRPGLDGADQLGYLAFVQAREADKRRRAVTRELCGEPAQPVTGRNGRFSGQGSR